MRTIYTFGFISGIAMIVGFLPHILALAFILFSGMDQNLLTGTTVNARAVIADDIQIEAARKLSKT